MSDTSVIQAGAIDGVPRTNGYFPPAERPQIGGPVERKHASDEVFRALAGAVLNKQLAAGSCLPPERELSDRFGVSRIVVREAVHRLKEYGLVRVRQGSPTLILDAENATDIRLLGLETDLIPHDARGIQTLVERQLFAGAAVLDLAEQRMTVEEIDALESIVDRFLAAPDRQAAQLELERDFWIGMAKGSRNRIYLRETRWYFNLLQENPQYRHSLSEEPVRHANLYKALLAAQRKREGSAQLYLRALRARGSAGERPGARS